MKSFQAIAYTFIFGVLIIILLVFNGVVERLAIFLTPFIIILIIRDFKLNHIFKMLITLVITYVICSIVLCYLYGQWFEAPLDFKGEDRDNTAIVLLSDGEPFRYEIDKIMKNIYKDESALDKILAPIRAFEYKRAYEMLGTSRYYEISNIIRNELKYRLKNNYDVHLYFYNDDPYIFDHIDMLSRSYDRIILCPIAISGNHDYDDLEEMINTKLINNNSTIKKLPYLWRSKKLMRSMYFDIVRNIPSEKAHASGVILLKSEEKGLYEQTIMTSELTQRLTNYGIDKKTILPVIFSKDNDEFEEALGLLIDKEIYNIVVLNVSSIESNMIDRKITESIIKKETENINVNINYISGWGISDELLDEIEYEIRINNLK